MCLFGFAILLLLGLNGYPTLVRTYDPHTYLCPLPMALHLSLSVRALVNIQTDDLICSTLDHR